MAPLVGVLASTMDAGSQKESQMSHDIFCFATAFCSWNCRALFTSCYTPRARAVRKMQLVKRLCAKYPVVLLQETHGTHYDVDTLDKEIASHRHYMSVIPGKNAGGVVVSIGKQYLEKFCGVAVHDIIPGRALAVHCRAEEFVVNWVCLHLDPSLEVGAAEIELQKIRDTMEVGPNIMNIVSGDFNSSMVDEPRLKVHSNSISFSVGNTSRSMPRSSTTSWMWQGTTTPTGW